MLIISLLPLPLFGKETAAPVIREHWEPATRLSDDHCDQTCTGPSCYNVALAYGYTER